MRCEKDYGLRKKIVHLSKSQLKEHLNDCSVCKKSLDRAYDLYKQEKEDPLTKSFPAFNVAQDKEEFLNFWKISLNSTKDRFDYYKAQLKEKMNETSMKSLILELVTELVKSLKADEEDRIDRKKALYEIIEIMDGEFLDQEFEMFFGFSKENVIKIIDHHLEIDKEGESTPGK